MSRGDSQVERNAPRATLAKPPFFCTTLATRPPRLRRTSIYSFWGSVVTLPPSQQAHDVACNLLFSCFGWWRSDQWQVVGADLVAVHLSVEGQLCASRMGSSKHAPPAPTVTSTTTTHHVATGPQCTGTFQTPLRGKDESLQRQPPCSVVRFSS